MSARMIKLSKEFRFEASHRLDFHDGKCANLHGHSWIAVISILSTTDAIQKHGAKENMLMDYSDLKKPMKAIIDRLDHSHLNDVFNCQMPTSEYIAQWMFDTLKASLPDLFSVEIKETCTSECVVFENPNDTNARLLLMKGKEI